MVALGNLVNEVERHQSFLEKGFGVLRNSLDEWKNKQRYADLIVPPDIANKQLNDRLSELEPLVEFFANQLICRINRRIAGWAAELAAMSSC